MWEWVAAMWEWVAANWVIILMLPIVLVLQVWPVGFIVGWFLSWLRGPHRMNVPEPRGYSPRWLTGVVERWFFTVLVAFDVSGAVTAMIAWLGAKLAANWNRQLPPPVPEQTQAERDAEVDCRTRYAVSALLAGLVSMSFAAIGGLILRYI